MQDRTFTSTGLKSVKNDSNSKGFSVSCRKMSSESLPSESSALRSHELPAISWFCCWLLLFAVTASWGRSKTNVAFEVARMGKWVCRLPANMLIDRRVDHRCQDTRAAHHQWRAFPRRPRSHLEVRLSMPAYKISYHFVNQKLINEYAQSDRVDYDRLNGLNRGDCFQLREQKSHQKIV